MKHLSYENGMRILKLPSLHFRRHRGDLIETFKILNNYYDPKTTSNLLERVPEAVITRSHNIKLKMKTFNTNQYKYFYTNRIVNLWNSLPTHIVNSQSLNIFKDKIDIHFAEYMYAANFNLYYEVKLVSNKISYNYMLNPRQPYRRTFHCLNDPEYRIDTKYNYP